MSEPKIAPPGPIVDWIFVEEAEDGDEIIVDQGVIHQMKLSYEAWLRSAKLRLSRLEETSPSESRRFLVRRPLR